MVDLSLNVPTALEQSPKQESEQRIPLSKGIENYILQKVGVDRARLPEGNMAELPALIQQIEARIAAETDPQQKEALSKARASYKEAVTIRSRVEGFVSGDAIDLDAEMKTSTPERTLEDFPESVVAGLLENTPEAKKAFLELSLQHAKELVQGQELKIKNAEAFASQMRDSVIQLVNEKAIQDNLPADRKKELLKEHLLIVQSAIDAISHQDTAAAQLTLGDHGWMHLVQDFRDSQVFAEGLKGTGLNAKDKFLLGLTAAYHDIGYTDPAVHHEQYKDPKFYDFDKGHPALSAAYVVMHSEQFLRVMENEDFEKFYTMVLQHEGNSVSPQGKSEDEDRNKRSYLEKAFSLADVSAVFGTDKLPAILGQFPETITYLSLLDMNAKLKKRAVEIRGSKITDHKEITLLDQMIETNEEEQAKVRSRLETTILTQSPKQSADLSHALSHFSDSSLSFVLGRVAGEMSPVKVDGQFAVFTVNGGLGNEFETKGYFGNANESVKKLTVKLFMEMGGDAISRNEDLKKFITDFLKSPAEISIPAEWREMISLSPTGEVTLTSIENKTRVVFQPETKVDTAADGYNSKLNKQLQNAQDLRAIIGRKADQTIKSRENEAKSSEALSAST